MKGHQTFDHERVSLDIARIRRGGCAYEIVIDPDKAIAFRNGKLADASETLKSEHVFFDARKGDLASESQMEAEFGSADPVKVAAVILKDGEMHLTAEYKAQLREEKRKGIIVFIHRNGADPRTHLPHPPQRIEAALDQAKVRIDEFARVEDQVQDIIKRLRPILPIRFEVQEFAIRIPPEHAARTYSLVKGGATITQESWQTDGSWIAKVELPAGATEEFFDRLNSATHGGIESKLLSRK
ncbi:ribosome assembly factor SBDS [Candidatus Woesearchaeota archaeon]|nr:ribosome assembly factor SBDS [Candidatus Woesearchaeota archaeon]